MQYIKHYNADNELLITITLTHVLWQAIEIIIAFLTHRRFDWTRRRVELTRRQVEMTLHRNHLIFVILEASKTNKDIFEASKINESILDVSNFSLKSLLKSLKGIYVRGRVMYIFDALSKYAIIFQCYFWRVMQIFEASKIMTLPPE